MSRRLLALPIAALMMAAVPASHGGPRPGVAQVSGGAHCISATARLAPGATAQDPNTVPREAAAAADARFRPSRTSCPGVARMS